MTAKSLLRLLGLSSLTEPTKSEADTLGKIADALGHLAPERARFVALLASLLGRVAYADFEVSQAEHDRMRSILTDRAALTEPEADVVLQIAIHQTRLFGATQSYQMARDFKAMSERDDRLTLLDCLFQVAAADGEISAEEERELTKIAGELGLDRDELTAVRAGYREHRTVLK